MDELQRLLNNVTIILQQEKVKKEESRKRGEQFNIFEVLGIQTSEVRLHSAFVSELLNPQGNHGLGDKFLIAFVDEIVKSCKSFEFDSTTAQVITEFYIGPISEDCQEGGRIDMLVQDKDGHLIIVENKIYAGDQDCQLLRYHNYARKSRDLRQENFILLYLTLNDGNRPSENSTGKNEFEFFCISYRTHILNWLEKCVALASRHPLIRETIQQYIINLKNILCIMENSDLEKYLGILTSDENISTTIGILERNNDIQDKIREEFVKKLKVLCNETLELECEYDDGVCRCESDKWIRIWDKRFPDVQFRVGAIEYLKRDGYRMDIKIPSDKKVKESFKFKFWQEGHEPNATHPVGGIYLWSETGKRDSGNWWWWNDWDTLRDMTNGKMLGFIKETLCHIKEQDLFRQISDNLDDNRA